MKTNESEDVLNSLLKEKYIDLNNVDYSRYSCDGIINENLNAKTEKKNNNELKPEAENINNDIFRKRSQTTFINKSSSSDFSVDEIPEKYLNDPINFIDYIEFIKPRDEIRKLNANFPLKKHKNSEELKYDILDIKSDKELNKLIFENEIEEKTVIFFYEDYLITGDILGILKVFSLCDKKLIKKFNCPLKNEKSIQITCIDIADDGRTIFAGFTNGDIAMYDLKGKYDYEKLLLKDVHSSECLNIKFLSKEYKYFKIITSEQNGNVLLTTIKDGMTHCRKTSLSTIYTNKEYPTFLIKKIIFNEKQIKLHPFIDGLQETIIFGRLDSIDVYTISDFKKLFSFEKPSFLENDVVPDITYGFGINREIIDEGGETNLLMCVSWDNVVYLYFVTIDNKEFISPFLIGYYVNDNQIIRINFVSKGTICLIDKCFYVKLLSTRNFNNGDPIINADTKKVDVPKNNNKADLQNIIKFEKNISKRISSISPNNNKETYLNSISENFISPEILILCSNSIYRIKLTNYEDCLIKLQKNEKWLDLFILGIEIFQGRITCFNEIPKNSVERKDKVRGYLQQLISQYIIMDFQVSRDKKSARRNSFYEEMEKQKKLENKIEVIIEFCIEIEAIECLLEKIFVIYESKGNGDLFLSKLQNFILCDKVIKYELNEEIILNIIKLYEGKKNLSLLNILLLHIDLKSIDNANVKKKINDLALVNPLINIYVNKEKNYLQPIKKLYELYQISNEIKNFSTYKELIEKEKLIDIVNSKEFLGHKLLWYIKKSLDGKKYPYFIQEYDKEDFINFVIDLLFWIIKDNIIKDLIHFDPKNYFEILTKMITGNKTFKILNENYHKKGIEEKIKSLNENNNNIYSNKDIAPKNIINYIIAQFKSFGDSSKIKLHYHLFILNCNTVVGMEKENILESIIYTLSEYPLIYKNETSNKKLVHTLIIALDNGKFTETDYRNVLLRFNNHIFDEIKVLIFKKIKSYKEGLDLILDKNSIIEDKSKKVIDFINDVLRKLLVDKIDNTEKNFEEENFDSFKKYILNKIVTIGEISPDQINSIILIWFYNDENLKKELVSKLAGNSLMQLSYVSLLANEYIDSYKENENNLLNQEDRDWIIHVLKLYINLLCVLNKKKEILPTLKKCNLFPVDYCLSLCTKYKVIDASIYLYQLSGDISNAVKVSLTSVDDIYDKIIIELKSETLIDKNYEEYLQSFIDRINDSEDIMLQYEQEANDNHDCWFIILNKLYEIDNNFSVQISKFPKNKKTYYEKFNLIISDSIKDLLEKMSIYVGIKRVLEVIQEKNKTASFKEIKPILTRMFEQYSNQNYLLECVRKLLVNTCFINYKLYEKNYNKGKEFNLINCDVCNSNFAQEFSEKQLKMNKILLFKCGHIFHFICLINHVDNSNNSFLCPICQKDDIKNVDKNNFNRVSTQKKEDKKVSLNKYGINIRDYKRGFNRMKAIDENYRGKKSMFINSSVKACRSYYRFEGYEEQKKD